MNSMFLSGKPAHALIHVLLVLVASTLAQGPFEKPILQCVNRLRSESVQNLQNLNQGFERCDQEHWALENIDIRNADQCCLVARDSQEDSGDGDSTIIGTMGQRIAMDQSLHSRIDTWGMRGSLEAEFKVSSTESLLSEIKEPDAPIFTYTITFLDDNQNEIDTERLTKDFWFNPLLRSAVENPVEFNQTLNSAVVSFHSTFSEMLVIPQDTRMVELRAQLWSRHVCIRMLQIHAEPSLAQPTWTSDFIGGISLLVLAVSAMLFALGLLPRYRRRQTRNAPFRRVANVFGRQSRKLWVSLLFVMNSMMMWYIVSFIQNRFLDDADIAAEVYITILLTIGLMVIGIVFLPIHLAQESAVRSKKAVGWGIYCMTTIVIQLPLHYYIFRDIGNIDSGFVAAGYAAWPLVNLIVFAYFIWSLKTPRGPRVRDSRWEEGEIAQAEIYDRSSTAYEMSSIHPSLMRENRYVAEMLRDYDNSDDIANMHPMLAFQPTAIARHLLSKRSSLRQRLIPLPLQTVVVAIILVAWMIVNQLLSTFFAERALEACTFPRIIPYLNFYLAEWTGITLPPVRYGSNELEGLTSQFYGVFTAGVSISIVFTVLLLVYHIGGMLTAYDIDISKLRRGDYARITYAPTFTQEFTLKDAAAYMGTQVGFGFFGIVFISTIFFFFFTGLAMILSLEGIQIWLLSVIKRLAPLLLAVGFSFGLGYFLDRQFERNIGVPGTGFWTKHPGHWSIHHYFMFPVALLESILGFAGRLVANTIGVVLYSMRLDVGNQVGLLSFFERSGGVYSSFLLADHHYNNPIMWSFLFIVSTTAADRIKGVDPASRNHCGIETLSWRPGVTIPGHQAKPDQTRIPLRDLDYGSKAQRQKSLKARDGGPNASSLQRGKSLKKSLKRGERPVTLVTSASSSSIPAPDPLYQSLSKQHKAMIARTRWFLAYTLINNPELISQRYSARKRQWWRHAKQPATHDEGHLTAFLDPAKLADRAVDGSKRLVKGVLFAGSSQYVTQGSGKHTNHEDRAGR